MIRGAWGKGVTAIGVLVGMTCCGMAQGQMSKADAEARIRMMQGVVPVDPTIRALTADRATLARYIAASDPVSVRCAIEEARRRRDPALTPALATRLSDRRNAALSALAATALGNLSGEPCRVALRAGINDARLHVRIAAGLALAHFGDRAAIPALRDAVNQTDPAICVRAALALSLLQDRQAIPRIVSLTTKLDSQYRASLCDSLGRFRTPVTERRLREMLAGEEYSGTRVHAARALGISGNRAALPALLAALKDRSCDVRLAAALALEKVGDSGAIPALEQAARESAPNASNAPTTDRKARAAARRIALTLAHPTLARTLGGGPETRMTDWRSSIDR